MLNNRQILANNHALSFSLIVEKWCKETYDSKFALSTKLDWSPRRRSSRGGLYSNGPGINIAMNASVPNTQGSVVYRFYEYPSYDSDKVIGGFYAIDPYIKLEAIITHEIAHALQFYHYVKSNTRCKPHGPVFKSFYSALRKQFINHKLPDQLALEKDYNSYKPAISSILV